MPSDRRGWNTEQMILPSALRSRRVAKLLRAKTDAIVSVATATAVPCLNMWRTLGINETNYKDFTLDGIHSNETGAIIRGEVHRIIDQIKFLVS